jgi:hypothetical protein
MTSPAPRAIFRQAALRHLAERPAGSAVVEVPRPPFVVSAAILAVLLVLAATGLAQFRVSEYATASVSVRRAQPGGLLELAVRAAPPVWAGLREGRTILLRSPSGEVFARTRIVSVDRPTGTALVSVPEKEGARDALAEPGARFRADIETSRGRAFSRLPLVGGLG